MEFAALQIRNVYSMKQNEFQIRWQLAIPDLDGGYKMKLCRDSNYVGGACSFLAKLA